MCTGRNPLFVLGSMVATILPGWKLRFSCWQLPPLLLLGKKVNPGSWSMGPWIPFGVSSPEWYKITSSLVHLLFTPFFFIHKEEKKGWLYLGGKGILEEIILFWLLSLLSSLSEGSFSFSCHRSIPTSPHFKVLKYNGITVERNFKIPVYFNSLICMWKLCVTSLPRGCSRNF